MPLHGKDGERPVADGLDRAVLRAGEDLKPRPQPPDGLMVCTVDHAARAVQLAQKARRGVDGMQPVNAVNLTVALDVLTQRAAKIDVEDLQPAADADDRLSRAAFLQCVTLIFLYYNFYAVFSDVSCIRSYCIPALYDTIFDICIISQIYIIQYN